MLREYLRATEAEGREPMVVVPQLSVAEIGTLFEYVFARDRYRPDEFPTLRKVCRELGVPAELLPEELTGHDDDEEEEESDDVKVVLKRHHSLTITPIPLDDSISKRKGLKRKALKSAKGKGKKAKLADSKKVEDEENVVETVPITADSDSDFDAPVTAATPSSPTEPSLHCQFCPNAYSHVKARNRHMLSEHRDDCRQRGMYFECAQCGQAFTSATGRSKHVMRVHSQKEIGGATADSVQPDNIMIDAETGVQSVKCPFDHQPEGAVVLVRTLKDFRDHIAADHPEKDKSCMICTAPFDTKEALVEHLQTHSGPEGDFLFTCEHCR